MARARRKVSGMRFVGWQSLDRSSLPTPDLSPDICGEQRGKQFSRRRGKVALNLSDVKRSVTSVTVSCVRVVSPWQFRRSSK